MKLSKKDKDVKGEHQATSTKLKRDMREGPLVDRISDMLHEVYYNQDVPVRMNELMHKHDLPTVIGPGLRNAGVMECVGGGSKIAWKWISKEEPSHELAERVFQEVVKRREYHTQRSKNKSVQAVKDKAIESNINKRNMSKIDRQLVANDHMLMDLSERLSRVYGLIKYLHLLLANKGWVLGKEINLVTTPVQFQLPTSILQHIYPNVLEKRGTLNNFEVRVASDSAPAISDAADIIRKERDHLVQVSVNDPAAVKVLLGEHSKTGMPYSEFAVTDSLLDAVVANMIKPEAERLDEIVETVNAAKVDDLHEIQPDVNMATTPQQTWGDALKNAQLNEIVHPKVAAEVNNAVADNNERRLILDLAKKFARLKEYQTASDLLTDLGV